MRRYEYEWASLVVQTVKKLPATQETWVSSLDQEDPLKIPKDRGTWQAIYSSWGHKELDMIDSHTHTHTNMYRNLEIMCSGERTF